MKLNHLFILSACLVGSALSNPAFSQDKALQSALDSEIRSDAEKARDESRKPAETLAFFDVKPDSKVLELIPGGGWYTKILGNYLKDDGALYLAIGANPDRLNLGENQLDHVKIIGQTFKLTPEEGDTTSATDLGETGFDVALTFRNMHNLDAQKRQAFNAAVFTALKPGGIYGVIDHTKRHMQADSDEIWRREDPVLMIKEIISAGFEFVDFSDIHARPNDGLIYDTTHQSINRDSDRFSLKFRKPE